MDLKSAIEKRLDGRSQAWLAGKTGMTKQYLNMLINDKKSWNLTKMLLVANALNVPLWRLIKEAEGK